MVDGGSAIARVEGDLADAGELGDTTDVTTLPEVLADLEDGGDIGPLVQAGGHLRR